MQAHSFSALALLALCAAGSLAQEIEPPLTEAVISVADQRLVLLRDGMWIGKYRVSTSKFGLGDAYGSYKTPVGQLRVCEKIGGDLAVGAVIKHRHATGEILPVNAPGRDPIVTRVIWLEGLEERNAHAKSRGIYIHGTVEEAKIGEPVSYGCIRMRSREVADLYEHVPVGTLVTIQAEKLPKYRRWTAPEPMIIAARTAPKQPGTAALKSPRPALAAADTATPSLASRPPDKRPRDLLPRTASESPSVSLAAPTRVTFAEPPEKSAANASHAARVARDQVAGAFKGSILFADLPGHGFVPRPVSSPSVPEEVLDPVGEELKTSAESPENGSGPLPRVTFRTGLSASTSAARGTP